MKRINALVIPSILLLILWSCDRDEVVKVPKSSFVGIVRDEFGDLLDSVRCTITSSSNGNSTITKDGHFNFKLIDVGTYSLTLSKDNYVTVHTPVEIKAEPNEMEFVLTSGNSFLRVSDSVLTPNYKNGSKDIIVESNAQWTVESDVSWLLVSFNSNSGSKKLNLSWKQSEQDDERIGNVTIKIGSLERKIKVIQSPQMKLFIIQAIIGNRENGIKDSITLLFNQPIAVNSLTSNYEFCISDINYKVHGKKLSFAYECARLGEEYPFSISVKDRMNENSSFQFNAQFFTRKLTLEGGISDYFIDDDNKTIWAVLGLPNRIVKISLDDLTVESSYNLGFLPARLQKNTYNNLISIFDAHGQCYSCDSPPSNYIYYFNPANGLIKQIKIEPIEGYDHPNYPSIFPVSLETMQNGLGVLITSDDSGNNKWRFVDAAHQDSMFISPTRSEVWYPSISLNHDRSEILMMQPWSTSIDILKIGSPIIITRDSPIPGASQYIVPNRKTNRVFHGQLYEQFISDMEDYVSQVTYIDTRAFYWRGGDFSYRSGEEETIYYFNDDLFQMLDYKAGFTNFTADKNPTLLKIHSTTDGKFLVGIKETSGGTMDLMIFDIESTLINKLSSPNSGGRTSGTENNGIQSVWNKK